MSVKMLVIGLSVKFEVFTAVAMKNTVFWDVTPCGSILRLLVSANFVTNSPIPVTLIMEAVRPSGTSVLTRATRLHIPEDGTILLIISLHADS
jgi:hypothetical protein